MIKRGLATFLLAFSCSLADAGMDIQRQFCERHSDLRDFDSRWEPYARKWVISLDTLRSLFTGPGFILVPFTRSQRDFENYFNVRYNIGG
ncbi:MAG: hypothetical protein LBB18_03050, partial [Puniceicoccales bacterium]|nr:hypothetical protein [Puniceicoccales bacterium]